MNGLTILAFAIVVLFLGYRVYARWLERTWGIDPNAKTPAQLLNDGKDYTPANKWSVFAHQFTSITGAGPVTGPIIAAMFGWLPALLWILFGSIFSVVFKTFPLFMHLSRAGENPSAPLLKSTSAERDDNYFYSFVGSLPS